MSFLALENPMSGFNSEDKKQECLSSKALSSDAHWGKLAPGYTTVVQRGIEIDFFRHLENEGVGERKGGGGREGEER
uniref:Uncharacterized protein n=1 Tax=Vespula pensylvanica TaxID=30213 RepID=A0A834UFX5_VESPE|nr:hypothetical protein H0235_000140 [Vespula pensylvanica]